MEVPKDAASALNIVNASIAEFAANTDSMDKIAQYSRMCWAADRKVDNMSQLRKYSVDALVNVAYFVHRISRELDIALSLEAQELCTLDLQLKGLSSRLNGAHRIGGAVTLETMRLPRQYGNESVASQVCQPNRGEQQMRKPIDFRSLDGVGVSLTPGQPPSASILQTWVDGNSNGGNNTTPSNNNNAAIRQQQQQQQQQQPARLSAPLPPPPQSFGAPPSQGAMAYPPPPPPPPQQQQQQQDDEWDLPAPPPPPDVSFASTNQWLPPPPPPPPPI